MLTQHGEAILHWFSILSSKEQAAVIACLDDDDRHQLEALLQSRTEATMALTTPLPEWLLHRHFAAAPPLVRALLANKQLDAAPALRQAILNEIEAVRQRQVTIDEHRHGISDNWLTLKVRAQAWKAKWVRFIKTCL